MHTIPWYIALLISAPQTILIIEFGFRLFNIRIRTRDTLVLGFLSLKPMLIRSNGLFFSNLKFLNQ